MIRLIIRLRGFVELQTVIDNSITQQILDLAPMGTFYSEMAKLDIEFQLSSARYRREKNLFAPTGNDFRRAWREKLQCRSMHCKYCNF